MSENVPYDESHYDNIYYNNIDAYTVFKDDTLLPDKTVIIAKMPRNVDSVYPWNIDTLLLLCREYNISKVISLVLDPGDIKTHLDSKSIDFVHIHLNVFRPDAKNTISKITDCIIQHDGNILIYCNHGVNRSGIVYAETMHKLAIRTSNTSPEYSIPNLITYFNARRGVSICIPHIRKLYGKVDTHISPVTSDTEREFMFYINQCSQKSDRVYTKLRYIKWLLPISKDIMLMDAHFMSSVYMITDKADGKRCYVFVHNNTIYIIFRDNTTMYILNDYIAHTGNTYILDAEYISSDSDCNIYVFDILYSSVNVKIVNEPLDNRLVALKASIDEIVCPILHVKRYTMARSRELSLYFKQKSDYNIDGYILIDNAPYWKAGVYKLKWHCTVDLKIRSYPATISAYSDLLTSDGKVVKSSVVTIDKDIHDTWLKYTQTLALDGCVGEFVVSVTKHNERMFNLVRIRDKKANSSMVVDTTIREHTFNMTHNELIHRLLSLVYP